MTNAPIEPVTVPAPSRPARIAALHAAGLFLAEHLDLPMPASVTMSAYELTWPQLTALADLHQVAIEYGDTCAWVNIPVALETLHGIEIEYTAFSQGLPKTTPMDLPPRVGVVLPEGDPWGDVRVKVVLPEGDPWGDVMPPARGRCTGAVMGARCVHPSGHNGACFYDDDETNGAHGA